MDFDDKFIRYVREMADSDGWHLEVLKQIRFEGLQTLYLWLLASVSPWPPVFNAFGHLM